MSSEEQQPITPTLGNDTIVEMQVTDPDTIEASAAREEGMSNRYPFCDDYRRRPCPLLAHESCELLLKSPSFAVLYLRMERVTAANSFESRCGFHEPSGSLH